MEIKKILREGEQGLNAYKNLIGIGVIFTILLGCCLIAYSSIEQQKIAEKCGFDDGKVKCVCTDEAWNKYQEDKQFEPNFDQNP